jgi:hypothetical protein
MAAIDVLNDPSYENPKMPFNNGQVSDGQAVLDSSLPDIAGAQSSWTVTEWSQTAYLQPTQLIATDSSLADPNYGNPLYTWQSSTGLTDLSVYSQNGATAGGAPYVYYLEETSGDTGTGADLFLQSNPSSPIPMNNPLTLSLNMKVTRAVASYSDLHESDGLAQVFAGFDMVFNAPGTADYDASLPTISALMQIGMVNSNGNGDLGTANHYLNDSGNSIIYQFTPPEDPTLAFQATSGGPTELTYNVNDVLDAMITDDTDLPTQATNLSNWAFIGFYIGEEVGGAVAPLSVGVQISNLTLQTDPSQTVAYQASQSIAAASTSAVATPEVAPTLFSISDNTLNSATVEITADSYSGPLSFMSHGDAYSYDGSDNVTVSALGASDPLLATGSGDDSLVGASTGHSTLDAGTGINIDVDGGSKNTTFVQNNYLPGQTWDFIEGWGGNDMDIFFGYIPSLSTIAVANGGLGDYQGATVTINPGNGTSNSATFVGIPASSLTGTYADIEGVPSWIVWSK